MFTQIKNFFSSYLVQIMAGALAVSLLGNIILGIEANHYANKATACSASVKIVKKAAEEKKQIVETRQEKNVVKTQDRISGRIANATERLRSNRPKPSMSSIKTSPENTTTEGGAAVVLPAGAVVIDGDTYTNDQRICTVNTIKAEEWQNFYSEQENIFIEENVGK